MYKGRVTLPEGHMLTYELLPTGQHTQSAANFYLTDRSTAITPAPRTFLGKINYCQWPEAYTTYFTNGTARMTGSMRQALDELLTWWDFSQWYHLPIGQDPPCYLQPGDAELIQATCLADEARYTGIYAADITCRLDIDMGVCKNLKNLWPREKRRLMHLIATGGVWQPNFNGQPENSIICLWGLNLVRFCEPREGMTWFYVPQYVQRAVETLTKRKAEPEVLAV